MRLVQIALLALIILLQYRYWIAENGVLDQKRLEKEIIQQQSELIDIKVKNAELKARVDDLKSGNDAIEELARQDLGLTKPGEIFVIIVDEGKTE